MSFLLFSGITANNSGISRHPFLTAHSYQVCSKINPKSISFTVLRKGGKSRCFVSEFDIICNVNFETCFLPKIYSLSTLHSMFTSLVRFTRTPRCCPFTMPVYNDILLSSICTLDGAWNKIFLEKLSVFYEIFHHTWLRILLTIWL